MRKIWLIARREYLYNFRRRSFLFTAFGVPLFSIGMMFVIFTLAENTFAATGQLGSVGYVDLSEEGVLASPTEQPEEYIAFASEEEARAAFDAGEIGAYFVIRPNYLDSGLVDAYGHDAIPEGIEDQLETFLQVNVARQVPENVPTARLLNPMDVTVIDLRTGAEMEDLNAFIVGVIFRPIIFGMIFLMAISTTSQFLMSGVVEEKENRMMEILATSSTPLQLLWGKVLGLGALGLTQVVLWGVALFVILNTQGGTGILAGMSFTADYIVVSLIYFVLGYFLYGAVMVGIGAAVTAEQEGRQFSTVFAMITVLPFMLSITFFTDANGTIPLILSLFPLTAPLAVIMRMPLATVPVWQIILSMVLLALSTVLVMWLAARVFRLGMLMYGKNLSLREIVRAMREGRQTMTSVAHAQEQEA